MKDFRGHDADGGQVLKLSLHDVEMIVESPNMQFTIYVTHSEDVSLTIYKELFKVILLLSQTSPFPRPRAGC